MFVRFPSGRGGKWKVTISKGRSPLSPVVETVECGSREEAYQAYQRMKVDVLAMPDPPVTIPASVVHYTEGAWLLNVGKPQNIWIPKTVAKNNMDGTFTLPESWAYDKGLIE